MLLRDRIEEVRDSIARAVVKANREMASVRLVAVSKTHPLELIREAYATGQTVFGESRIQEAQPKIEQFLEPVEWHLIGHLQSNKVRLAVRLFHTIHSVDSVKLIREIAKRADQIGRDVDILIQVNVSGETSKHGLAPVKLQEAIDLAVAAERLHLKGFMTMAPFSSNPEDSRVFFASLRKMAYQYLVDQHVVTESQLELSMGMSGDYGVAIEEGATLVRVGTAIFGSR